MGSPGARPELAGDGTAAGGLWGWMGLGIRHLGTWGGMENRLSVRQSTEAREAAVPGRISTDFPKGVSLAV